VRSLLVHVLGGRPMIHLAMLWYATHSGYRTDLLPMHQAGEAHSIFGRMTVRVRYWAM
jgi:hypothetical protein